MKGYEAAKQEVLHDWVLGQHLGLEHFDQAGVNLNKQGSTGGGKKSKQ